MKYLILIVVFILTIKTSSSQVVYAGLKGGYNLSWLRYTDSRYRDQTSIYPVSGFSAGGAFAFKMKDRYYLHTEILYATKGKLTKGNLGLKDRVIYNYIEVPLIYKVYFKSQLKLKTVKVFKWHAGIGPNFSYWLGGKGAISNDELREYEVVELKYKMKFGKRPDADYGRSDLVYYDGVKRFQLGLNVGGGFLLEPVNNNKIMLDLRFEFGHTWLGKAESSDFIYPATYEDNLQARNMGLRLSLMYFLETNLDKKVRNKGKSTIKQKK